MSWIYAVIHGVGLGLLLSILIGPVFFLLIRISIEQGAKQALTLEVGVLGGDALYIWLSYIGTAAIFLNPAYSKPLGIVGSCILILMGTFPFFKKQDVEQKKDIEIKTTKPLYLIIKGFALNVTNPFVVFFWIASTGYAVTTFNGNPLLVFTYFTACILTYLIVDLVKIYTAVKIRNYLTPTILHKITMYSNIGIALLGLIMMYRVFKL